MKKSKRFTGKRLLMAIILVAIFSFGGRLCYLVGEYYQCLDDYSGAVIRRDQLAARDYLANLRYFQQLSSQLKRLKLDGLVGGYFFGEMAYYEAAYDYLTNLHERITENEKIKNDSGFWARYLRANSEWRLAQGIFAQSLKMDLQAKAEMQAKADQLAIATKGDYEAAIKMAQGRHLPSSWNYDLTTDDGKRAAALRPKPTKLPLKLGEKGKKDKGVGQDRGRGPNGNGSRDLNIEGPPGEAKQKPTPQRPG